MIRIRAITVNNVENVTTVEADIIKQVGSIQQIDKTVFVTLPQRYESITPELLDAVSIKLNESGIDPYPLEE